MAAIVFVDVDEISRMVKDIFERKKAISFYYDKADDCFRAQSTMRTLLSHIKRFTDHLDEVKAYLAPVEVFSLTFNGKIHHSLCLRTEDDTLLCEVALAGGYQARGLTYLFKNIEDRDMMAKIFKKYVGEVCENCCKVKVKKELKKCSVCRKAYYCDSKCQLEDWKDHKKKCQGKTV